VRNIELSGIVLIMDISQYFVNYKTAWEL